MGLTRPRAHQLQDSDFKASCRAISTSNVTLSGGAPATVDGVSLAVQDRILVTGQTTGSENGLYRVTTVGTGSNGTWVRAADADADGDITAGLTVMVTEGTTYADTSWKLTTDDPITVGTTSLTFEQASAYAFGTVSANGTNLVADSVGDTVTVSQGNNMVITGNATSDTMTIALSNDPSVTTVTASGNVTAANVTVSDVLRIAQSGSGLRMTNVGAFDNDGSDNFRIFATNDLTLGANGQNGNSIYIGTGNAVTINHNTTIKDGAIDFDVASHDGTNGLKLGGTLVTATAAELNYTDGMFDNTVANSIPSMNASNDGFTDSGMIYNSSTASLGIGVASAADIDARLHIVGTGNANQRETLFKVNNSNDHDRIEFIDESSADSLPSALRNRNASYGLGIIAESGPVRLYSGGSAASNEILRAGGGGVRFNNAYTFPQSDGSANQILQTDGSGALSFVDQSGISEVSDDTTPQLGGDLDLNSNDINGSGNVNVTGNISATTTITATGNVSGNNVVATNDVTTATVTASSTITATGNITGGNLVTSGTVTMDRLSLSSSQTTVPPLQLTANSLNDNVGSLRIDGSQPDIYLNQVGDSFTTVTFAKQNGSGNAQPMVGFGKNSDDNLYFFRETAQDIDNNNTTYDNGGFVFNRSSGNISMNQNLDVVGNITSGNLHADNLTTANAFVIVGSNGHLTEESTLTVDSSSNYLGINQTSPEVTLHMTGDGAQSAQIRMEQYNDTADAPDMRIRKGRGTEASASDTSAGDYLFRQNVESRQSNAWVTMASQQFDTDGTDATKSIYQLQTHDGTSLATRLGIDNSGKVYIGAGAYTFPTSDGSANNVLATDGSGALSFTGDPSFTTVTASGDIETTGGDLHLKARGGVYFYDTDSSNYVQIRTGSTVAANLTFNWPVADGTSGQVLQTDGAGTLTFATASGGGGGASGYQSSTITTHPAASGDEDLATGINDDTAETPFESGAQDAFGVSLGTVYDQMEPIGSSISIDLGDEEDYVGA
jgi:hypothetical protein